MPPSELQALLEPPAQLRKRNVAPPASELRKFLHHEVQEKPKPHTFPRPSTPTRFIPSFQSPHPINGSPCATRASRSPRNPATRDSEKFGIGAIDSHGIKSAVSSRGCRHWRARASPYHLASVFGLWASPSAVSAVGAASSFRV